MGKREEAQVRFLVAAMRRAITALETGDQSSFEFSKPVERSRLIVETAEEQLDIANEWRARLLEELKMPITLVINGRIG